MLHKGTFHRFKQFSTTDVIEGKHITFVPIDLIYLLQLWGWFTGVYRKSYVSVWLLWEMLVSERNVSFIYKVQSLLWMLNLSFAISSRDPLVYQCRFMPEQGSSCKWVFSKPRSPVFILCYSNLTSQSLRLYDILQCTEMCPYEWCRGKLNVAMVLYIFWEREIQLFSVGWIRNTACSPMPCFLEYCHHVEENRPLVGEGWVAAGPLRGLFLQGHTHAWSEVHRRGSGTRRLYLCCLTSVTPNSTSCRTITLWLSDWERVIKLVQSTEERVFF